SASLTTHSTCVKLEGIIHSRLACTSPSAQGPGTSKTFITSLVSLIPFLPLECKAQKRRKSDHPWSHSCVPEASGFKLPQPSSTWAWFRAKRTQENKAQARCPLKANWLKLGRVRRWFWIAGLSANRPTRVIPVNRCSSDGYAVITMGSKTCLVC